MSAEMFVGVAVGLPQAEREEREKWPLQDLPPGAPGAEPIAGSSPGLFQRVSQS